MAVTPSTKAARSGGAETDLDFAKCMRANGVPDFPDPQPGGGFVYNVHAVDPNAPAVLAAQAKCRRGLPGPPGPGTHTHPSVATMAKLVAITRCMRAHGASDFPDPRTSVPADPGSDVRVITDYDGAILLFPSTIDMSAPAYEHAAAACGVLAGKLGRGPHS